MHRLIDAMLNTYDWIPRQAWDDGARGKSTPDLSALVEMTKTENDEIG